MHGLFDQRNEQRAYTTNTDNQTTGEYNTQVTHTYEMIPEDKHREIEIEQVSLASAEQEVGKPARGR